MRRAVVLLLGCLLALAGCSLVGAPTSSPGPRFVAEVANYQLLAGRPNRFLVGLIGADGRWVSFGSARLRFTDPDGNVPPELSDVPAAFLPIPGTPQGDGQEPQLTMALDGRGVYAAHDLAFDSAGFWQVDATITLDGVEETANAGFEVLAEPIQPAVGDRAPSVDNAVLGDGVDLVALDSRARVEDELPDPELHRVSIADALAAHRPALIVFSTPVYCVSRFCGPITEMVSELAREYADRADFIHVEIWQDFESHALNPAAAAWLKDTGGEVREPWVYLVGADGRIAGSWDDVATRSEIEPMLQALPRS